MRIRSPLVKKESCYDCDGFSEKVPKEEKKSESGSVEENISRSPDPVEMKDLSYYFKTVDYDFLTKDESESEEEVLADSDRDEKDRGYNFVVMERSRTVTNPKVPQKAYFKSKGVKNLRIPSPSRRSVLRNPNFPVAAISKLALKTYNKIQVCN